MSCFLCSEFPQGTQWEVAAMVTSLMDEACFAYWSGRWHFSFTHFISDLNWLRVWGAVITLIGPYLHGGGDWIIAGPFDSDILAFSQYGGNIDTSFAVFLPEPWFVPLHLLSTWWRPQGICYGHIILKDLLIWNHLVSFHGSTELQYHSPLCLSTENNSARGKVIDKKWFIRIGCLWG